VIDWIIIVRNLQAVMPLQRASTACGMSKDWLRNIQSHKQVEPGFNAGLKLLRLHTRVCGRDPHSAALKRGRSVGLRVGMNYERDI